MPAPYSGAANQYLGLGSDLSFGGSNLTQQVQDQSEEEKRRKRLGLSSLQSSAAQQLLFGGASNPRTKSAMRVRRLISLFSVAAAHHQRAQCR